jgi:dephospho-CoA kinase
VREKRRAGFAAREARLLPDDEKLRRADFSYVNDGTLAELDDFVEGVMERLSSS